MHIGLAVFGTWGDVEPFATLCDALLARGHRVTWFVEPSMASRVRGGRVVSVGEPLDMPRLLSDPRSMDPRFVWREVYVSRVASFHAAILDAHASDPLDAVAAHVWTLGAQLGARDLGLPFTTVALQPMVWMSRASPPRLDALELPPWLYARAFSVVEPLLMKGVLGRPLRRAAAAAGIPSEGLGIRETWARAACNLGLWDPSFRAPQRDDPPRSHVVGHVGGASAEADPELEAFCVRKKPWIVALGSALPQTQQRPYELALEVVKEPLLLIGASSVGSMRGDVRVVERAPYGALFRHARGVIHHGGAGTTAHALRAGVPQCVLAMGNDMFDNGQCVERMGVGEVLVGEKVGAKRLSEALERLLRGDVVERAERAGARLVPAREALARAVSALESTLEAPAR